MTMAFAALVCIFSLVPGGSGSVESSPEAGADCEVANLLQRKTESSEAEAQALPSTHPFVEAVTRDCAVELSKMKGHANFYQKMQFLEATTKDLSSACRKTAFTGSPTSPNPKIFEVLPPVEIWTDLKGLPRMNKLLSVGYVKAPLIFSHPERSPVYKTWFAILHAKVQPAPGGILFVHQGGPLPRIHSDMQHLLLQFPKEQVEYVHENFDLLLIDQRGMGLSSIGLLKTNSFAYPDSMQGVMGMDPAILSSKGSLVEVVKDSKGVTHEFPCHQMSVDHKNEWVELRDMENLEEVNTFLDAKTKFTALCSAQFDRDDGEGGSYNLLQYMGTQALAHDLEWMRWALGAPSISFLGMSYGSLAAAAYSSKFPARVNRVAVSGVVAPIPDRFDYARKAAANTAMILGFIQAQCAADPKCMTNPWKEHQIPPGSYFKGNINDAVGELFRRSANGGQEYKDRCEGIWMSTLELSRQLEGYLVANEEHGWLSKYDQHSWPNGFLALPAFVFRMLQLPCGYAKLNQFKGKSAFGDELQVYTLIPALDHTGTWGKHQVAKFVTDFGKDVTFAPGLNIFRLYALQASCWPQQPTPIGFSHPDINAVIVNPMYDERTGMNNAQEFQLNFPKSSLVTAPVGGHCVHKDHGAEGYQMMIDFLCYGLKPSSGEIAGSFVRLNFTKGAEFQKNL